MRKTTNLLKIGAIYLGTVLGAGFASGQELELFFVRFSRRGILGCVLAGLLFCFLGALILAKAYDLPQKNYRAYLDTIFNKSIARFVALVTEVFLCVSFCIMLSGAGAFFRERLQLPSAVGIFITVGICLIVFLTDVKGLSLVNTILTPVMLVGSLYVAFYSIFAHSQPVWLPHINSHGRFLPYAIFYVGYNLLTLTAVLVPTSALAEDKKTAVYGGLAGGAMLTIIAIFCAVALLLSNSSRGSSLPMLILAQETGIFAYGLYSVVLYMAMLTTAVSTGFAVVERLCSLGVSRRMSAFGVCFCAIPLSFIEFSVLVKHCYVFFGILGVLLLAGIVWDWYKRE